jgi:hypothetical protein
MTRAVAFRASFTFQEFPTSWSLPVAAWILPTVALAADCIRRLARSLAEAAFPNPASTLSVAPAIFRTALTALATSALTSNLTVFAMSRVGRRSGRDASAFHHEPPDAERVEQPRQDRGRAVAARNLVQVPGEVGEGRQVVAQQPVTPTAVRQVPGVSLFFSES